MKTSKLPQTDSIQELARFWEKHDLTDFEDELEEVTEPVFVGRDSIRLHLPARCQRDSPTRRIQGRFPG